MDINDRLIRISIIADNYDKIPWDIFDWRNENSIFLYRELVNSVETINNILGNPKLLLTSSLELGIDILFSHMAIKLQESLGKEKIITQVAIPYLNYGIRYSDINKFRYKNITQNTDLIIFLSDKISDRKEIDNSRYWRVDNSDCIIMVTEDEDSELIRYTREKKVPITFIRPNVIISILMLKKKVFEQIQPLVYRERRHIDNSNDDLIDTAREFLIKNAKELLGLKINFEEDDDLGLEERIKKYMVLSELISTALVKFNRFVFKNN